MLHVTMIRFGKGTCVLTLWTDFGLMYRRVRVIQKTGFVFFCEALMYQIRVHWRCGGPWFGTRSVTVPFIHPWCIARDYSWWNSHGEDWRKIPPKKSHDRRFLELFSTICWFSIAFLAWFTTTRLVDVVFPSRGQAFLKSPGDKCPHCWLMRPIRQFFGIFSLPFASIHWKKWLVAVSTDERNRLDLKRKPTLRPTRLPAKERNSFWFGLDSCFVPPSEWVETLETLKLLCK